MWRTDRRSLPESGRREQLRQRLGKQLRGFERQFGRVEQQLRE
jgi:hypothetical protein